MVAYANSRLWGCREPVVIWSYHDFKNRVAPPLIFVACSWFTHSILVLKIKQGKSQGFDSCDKPTGSNLTQIGFKSSIFQPAWPWNLMDDLAKQYDTSSIEHQSLCIISNPLVQSKWSYSPEMLNSGQNQWFFVPCDLGILWMTLKNNRAPLLYYAKLSASFQSHWWIQTWVTIQKRSTWVNSKFDGWPWKTIGHLFYITPSFVHHFKATGDFKLTVRYRSIWVKVSNFFAPCDLKIWRMTLKSNRAPLLCCFKLCASLYSHQWIRAGVTVRKFSIRVKIGDFVPCDLEIWRMTLQNNRAPLQSNINLCASFHHHM